jgi:AcrR family transcriptional regulator
MTNNSPSSERRERHKVELRDKIRDAARELIVTQGVDQFSMRKLAAKIGYTATAIYFHFADKETLLQDLVDFDFKEFQGKMDPARIEPDPIHRILLMGRAFVSFFSQNPSHFRFLFMTPNIRVVPSEKIVTQGNPAEDNYCLLETTVAEAMSQGRFRPEFTNPHEVCQVLMATVHGVVVNNICKDAHPWIEFLPIAQIAESAMHSVMRGLLRNPGEIQ